MGSSSNLWISLRINTQIKEECVVCSGTLVPLGACAVAHETLSPFTSGRLVISTRYYNVPSSVLGSGQHCDGRTQMLYAPGVEIEHPPLNSLTKEGPSYSGCPKKCHYEAILNSCSTLCVRYFSTSRPYSPLITFFSSIA